MQVVLLSLALQAWLLPIRLYIWGSPDFRAHPTHMKLVIYSVSNHYTFHDIPNCSISHIFTYITSNPMFNRCSTLSFTSASIFNEIPNFLWLNHHWPGTFTPQLPWCQCGSTSPRSLSSEGWRKCMAWLDGNERTWIKMECLDGLEFNRSYHS